MSSTVNDSGTSTYSCAEDVPTASTAKREARVFERWFNEASPTWPDELKKLGTFAMLSLKTLDQSNPGEVMVREAAKDLAAFAEAYGAWKAGG